MNSTKEIIDAYDRRAPIYDSSFHAGFAAEVAEKIGFQKGQSVLDICCGTGLVSIAAKKKVGPSGRVVGLDFSPASLTLARTKAHSATLDIEFYEADCSCLGASSGIDQIASASFDHITVCSAIVLFPRPYEPLIASWSKFLKNGGTLTLDVRAAESNWVSDLFIESLVQNGLQTPALSSAWVKSHDSLRKVMEGAGLVGIVVTDSDAYNRKVHDVRESDSLFGSQLASEMWKELARDENREKLKSAKECYSKTLIDLSDRQNTPGKFESATVLYIGQGTKP